MAVRERPVNKEFINLFPPETTQENINPEKYIPPDNRDVVYHDDEVPRGAVLGTEFAHGIDNSYMSLGKDPAISSHLRRLTTYRQMREEETTIAAMLFLVNRLLLTVDWEVKGDRQEWVEQQFHRNMRRSFSTFLTEAQSFLMYGFALFEKVYQKLPDGTIGLWDLSPRPQTSVDLWGIETAPDVQYDKILYVQQDVNLFNFERIEFHQDLNENNPGDGKIRIPYEKLVHFKNQSTDSHPEGISILRPCYRAWRMLRDVEKSEITAVDRDLNGFPAFFLPGAMLSSNKPEVRAKVEVYKQLAKGIRVNNEAGVLLPSDPWRNQDGSYANAQQVDFKLMSSGGNRLINTDQVIRRLQASIARTILADFLVLGSGTGAGSYNLGSDKSDLFISAVSGWLTYIGEVLNRQVIPDLWKLNGWSSEPARIEHGAVQKMDIEKISRAMNYLANSGMPIFPTEDSKLEDRLMDLMDLPGTQLAEVLPKNIYDPEANKPRPPTGSS